MTRNDVLKKISEKTEYSQKSIAEVLTAFEDVIEETLRDNRDEKIKFSIGAFSVKHVPERRGISALGDAKEWVVPEHDEYTFRVGKSKKTIE